MSSEIDFKKMVARLVKPGDKVIGDMTPDSAHLLHMAVGISGECSELIAPALASMSGSMVDRDNLTEELGDSEFYVEGYASLLCEEQYSAVFDGYPVAPPDLSVAAMTLLLLQSAGEVLDLTKKHAIYAKELDTVAVTLHLSLVVSYLRCIAHCAEIPHEEILAYTINKLSTGKNARYKEGYTNEAAQLRADKQ
jgi:NTP pyrophosphatase (non-canonical NTP hydrolase)